MTGFGGLLERGVAAVLPTQAKSGLEWATVEVRHSHPSRKRRANDGAPRFVLMEANPRAIPMSLRDMGHPDLRPDSRQVRLDLAEQLTSRGSTSDLACSRQLMIQWSGSTVGIRSGSMCECGGRTGIRIGPIPKVHGCDKAVVHREYVENFAVR